MLEKLYLDASMEIDKEYEVERKSFKFSNRKICDIEDGEELWHYLETSNDMEVIFMGFLVQRCKSFKSALKLSK